MALPGNITFVQPTSLYSVSSLSHASSFPCSSSAEFDVEMPFNAPEPVPDEAISLENEQPTSDPLQASEAVTLCPSVRTNSEEEEGNFLVSVGPHLSMTPPVPQSPRSRSDKYRKLKALHGLLELVQIRHRRKILESALEKQVDHAAEEIAFTSAETIFEGKVCAAILQYQNTLR